MEENVKQVIEPMEFYIPLSEVIDRFDGGSYEIVKTKKTIEFRAKGGYRIFADIKIIALYNTIDLMLKLLKGDKIDGIDESVDIKSFLTATTQILELPMWIFTDEIFASDIALAINKHINKLYQDALSDLMDDDNPELTEKFQDATLAVENIAKEIKSIGKNNKEQSDAETKS